MHVCISIHISTSVYMTMSILKQITFLCVIMSRYVIGLKIKENVTFVSLEIIYEHYNPIKLSFGYHNIYGSL